MPGLTGVLTSSTESAGSNLTRVDEGTASIVALNKTAVVLPPSDLPKQQVPTTLAVKGKSKSEAKTRKRKLSRKFKARKSTKWQRLEAPAKVNSKAAIKLVLEKAVRYPLHEIPRESLRTDAVGAVVDLEPSSHEQFLPAKPVSELVSADTLDPSIVERVAAIKTVVQDDPTITKTTGVEWREIELPDKEQVHVNNKFNLPI